MKFIFPDISSTSGVYVLFAKKDGKSIPFYVGECEVIHKRIGDYIKADFKATTDFMVGIAIRHLRLIGYVVEADFCIVAGDRTVRKGVEKESIDKYDFSNFLLLNRDRKTKRGYNYKTADEAEVASRFRQEINRIISHNSALVK